MAGPGDDLFMALAQAKAQPSHAFRDAEAALSIPGQALGGYEQGLTARNNIAALRNAPANARAQRQAALLENFGKLAETTDRDTALKLMGPALQSSGVDISSLQTGNANAPSLDTLQKQFESNPMSLNPKQRQMLATLKGQQLRSNMMGGMVNVKEETLRKQLNDDARNTLNPFFQSGPGKMQASRLTNIGRAQALVDQMRKQLKSGDTRQMRELSTSLDQVLRGGGVGSMEQVNGLMPQTASGRYANWLEWFTSNPQGADQSAFVDRTADTLSREKNTVQGQVKQLAETTAPTLRLLKQNYPEDYQAQLDAVIKNPMLVGDTSIPNPNVPTGVPGAGSPSGRLRIRASDNTFHDIPQENLDAAKQIDPHLEVVPQ